MINEEGGIDPEQFRMEAMFDRMDAIGKSILGLTIQCAQCHNHKFDPLTQEEYYRMFAFLNNDHEANIAVYTPDEQMQPGRHLPRRSARSRPTCSTAIPTGRERMAAWEESVTRRSARRGPSSGPTSTISSTAARSIYLLDDGSFLAQGYAPTKHTVEIRRSRPTVPNITAFRLELLNDPNLPLGGPGPLDQGDVRADRVRASRPRPADAPREGDAGQARQRHGRRQPARDAARADLRRQERQAPRDRPGRVRHRRQGRDGLGHRRRPRPPQPAAQGGLRRREADRVPERHRS